MTDRNTRTAGQVLHRVFEPHTVAARGCPVFIAATRRYTCLIPTSTWSGCSAPPAYAAGGTTPVSAVNGAPSTCSTPPDPDAYGPYDAIAARPRHRFSTR